MDTANMNPDIAEALDELACAHRVLEMEGHGDSHLGHVSWRDPGGQGFWMKRHDIMMGEVMGPDDLLLIDMADGTVLAGEGRRHSEWLIHASVFRAREDVNAVGHTHPFHGVLFSATDEKLVAVGQHAGNLGGPVPHYKGTAALIHSEDQAADMAATLGDGWAVFLMNHGVTFCGVSVGHCVLVGVSLDQACREQLTIAATGVKWEGAPQQDVATRADQALYGQNIESFWQVFKRRLVAHGAKAG